MNNTWIQLSETNRIIGIKFQPPQADELDIWQSFDLPEEHFDDYNLYKVQNNTLVYDPHTPSQEELEKERIEQEQYQVLENAINNLPNTIEDTDAALCEIYEMLLNLQEAING